MDNRKGLIIVYTGDGKGKTTAALGAALRASGRGMKTLMIQFLKEKGTSAEQDISAPLLENIRIHSFGKGFIHDGDDMGPHRERVEAGWRFLEEELKHGPYDILILDEIASALNFRLLSIDKVITFLTEMQGTLHIILTGRNMPEELVEIADTVTEMKEIKHAYRKGIDATPGLDY
ncbi:MAG: cob(I)yrinic acid a,c-diamide adenosyltransferase [Syntrophus sp. (in: bacteria)]|nr:cob(I)yrinic acid a,c-diamide adenosyltransferase [Syntrophus sp. (in: bacteria)]